MSTRLAYRGLERKLVLAFDIGTTHSGISYCILDPGTIPSVNSVTRFPAYEYISGTAKVPSVIYYDRDGNIKAVGAEAMSEGIYEKAEERGWFRCEWFKLHMHPMVSLPSQQLKAMIPALPLGKNAVDVFADFLVYLYSCAATYIQESHPNGVELWGPTVDDRIDFVLSHPNGWKIDQQSDMRKAAVQAGLVSDTPAGLARLLFVSEGEASLHYAIQYGLPDPVTQTGEGVVIVDAGGGTIDVCSYSKASDDSFREIAASECHFSGSVSVSIRAANMLSVFLADSTYLEDVHHIARCFDKTTKLRFKSSEDDQYVKFGSARDNDPAHGIKYGQLWLEGSDVAACFEESIACMVEAVESQINAARKLITHAVLVGGFSASDWVYAQASKAMAHYGLSVIRPVNYINKAVSDGAIWCYLEHLETARVAEVPPITLGNNQQQQGAGEATDNHDKLNDVLQDIAVHNLYTDSPLAKSELACSPSPQIPQNFSAHQRQHLQSNSLAGGGSRSPQFHIAPATSINGGGHIAGLPPFAVPPQNLGTIVQDSELSVGNQHPDSRASPSGSPLLQGDFDVARQHQHMRQPQLQQPSSHGVSPYAGSQRGVFPYAGSQQAGFGGGDRSDPNLNQNAGYSISDAAGSGNLFDPSLQSSQGLMHSPPSGPSSMQAAQAALLNQQQMMNQAQAQQQQPTVGQAVGNPNRQSGILAGPTGQRASQGSYNGYAEQQQQRVAALAAKQQAEARQQQQLANFQFGGGAPQAGSHRVTRSDVGAGMLPGCAAQGGGAIAMPGGYQQQQPAHAHSMSLSVSNSSTNPNSPRHVPSLSTPSVSWSGGLLPPPAAGRRHFRRASAGSASRSDRGAELWGTSNSGHLMLPNQRRTSHLMLPNQRRVSPYPSPNASPRVRYGELDGDGLDDGLANQRKLKCRL